MLKRNPIRMLVRIFCLAIVMAGCFCGVRSKGSDNGKIGETTEKHLIGGGYAVTGQIPGTYFLPVLYDTSNGLPTSEANCILAASDGYIWIGGYGGIIKYDGVTFEKMPVTDGLTSGRDLFEDSTGKIWIATNDKGVVVIDGSERYRYMKQDGLSSNSIRTFAEDSRGNVFIGSTAGVAYVDPNMDLHRINDERINNKRILRLVSDTNGMVYGHTGNGDIFMVSADGIAEYYSYSYLGTGKITTILTDPNEPGKLYLGTNGKCIYYGRFGEHAVKMKKIDTAPAENIHWLHYACGHLWVSSAQIAGYLDDNEKFVPFESFPIKDSFEMMTSDFQGNIWFASSRYGVMKLVADNFLDFTGAARIEPEVVNATCKRGDDLYIGTDTGLRIVDNNYDSKVNYITAYFKDARIRCIMNDSNGNTWFSTFTKGLGLVRLNDKGELKKFTINSGLMSNEVRCTYEMKDGSLIVGTNAGIAVIKDDKVTASYGTEDGLSNLVILTVCEGDNGEIYAGTDGDGIYVLKDGVFRRIGSENGLDSDVIMRLKRDEKRGVMWVITSSSVEYIRNGVITNVTSFPYNNNFDVIFAGDSDLWFLSSKGIYVINAESVVNNLITDYTLYEPANGLTSVPISYCYSGLDEEGNLYVAGQTGVSAVNISDMYDFSGKTIAGIRSVNYDGVEIFPDADGKYVLPEKDGRIQINPAVIDYSISNPLVRVFLEGIDDEGITTSQNKLLPIEYTSLKYGRYQLHIQILDRNTRQVTMDNVFRIEKKPGFFERLSVRIILMVLALAAIGIIVWRIMTGTVIRKQYLQIQEARDEAQRANTAKSRFLANMSHEIRTPINTIMGMDEMILREDTKSVPREYYGPVTGYANNIKYASESLLNLINDLLDISKIESGKMHLVEQEYDTEEMLRGIASMIRGRAEDKKLFFDLDIDETLPRRLYGDSNKIKQIILNILTNAVKYTDEGGFTLTVKVVSRNDAGVALRISVKDTGIGIKSEDIEKLFKAYERLDEVKNSNVQGTGLGLDISRQFAEMMGGKLWCESVYGEGSEFLLNIKQKIVDPTGIGVFLERSDDTASKAYKPQFVAPDADILVVDDNPMNLAVIKGLLKPTKIFVTTANSGEECLDKIASNDFNVVLLDHMMPGMDGIETLEKIRVDHPDLPVYALTANATSGGEEFYVSKGFNGYLTKPIDIVAVEHAIMRHLPENIMSKPSEDDTVVEDTTLSEDLLWLENAEGISVEEGIRNSGGASQYEFSLNMFYESIDDNSAVIEKAYSDNDIKLATVKVHALKSSARIIGAMKLSEDCQKLEDAGNKKDTEYIDNNKDRMLADYRAFKEILKKLKNDDEPASDKTEISDTELKDAYSALKDCISQMDYDAIEMLISQLKEFKLGEKDAKILSELEKCFKLVNWEQMEEVINNV